MRHLYTVIKTHIFLILFLCMIFSAGCEKNGQKSSEGLQVITTLFPLYDFARSIAGDRAKVTMLLPPGVEPHSFEPKPEDMIRISRSGLFIYTSPLMEPWAETVIKGVDNKQLKIVNAGLNIQYQSVNAKKDKHHGGSEADHDHKGLDPHIWLDFANSAVIVDAVTAGFISADAANADYYRNNSETLKKRLSELDLRYRESLDGCRSRKLLHGGHYTFGYLTSRYNLDYQSLSGVSSDSEPSAARMVSLINQIRSSGARYLFAEELLSPRLTETLAKEASVGVLMLHGAHNLSRDEMSKGTTFFDLMERNLGSLQKGLGCLAK